MTDVRDPVATPDTWDDFAALVESNNGVWGGCWCMGFHPAAPPGHARATVTRSSSSWSGARSTRYWSTTRTDVSAGASSAPRRSCPTSRAAAPTTRERGNRPTGGSAASSRTRRTAARGSRRPRCGGALDEIKRAGGGVVEAYPEQTEDRSPQRGAYLHTGPEELYERHRVRAGPAHRQVAVGHAAPGGRVSSALATGHSAGGRLQPRVVDELA